ncbi:MAG: hypothetical protein ACI88C_000064 [Acidimicrobiales bacterium]|jgi:hypothetical protein
MRIHVEDSGEAPQEWHVSEVSRLPLADGPVPVIAAHSIGEFLGYDGLALAGRDQGFRVAFSIPSG